MQPIMHSDNSMTFTENHHGNAILENLRKQRTLERCCDVILHVDGKQFHAHRCILSACSPFFNSIFKVRKTIKEQLTISCESSEVFNDLLSYIYSGIIQINANNVSELLKLANKLHLEQLKAHCAEYLERYLSCSNCLTVLEMAKKLNLQCLEKISCSFIQENLATIAAGEEVLCLPIPKLENFIKSPHWTLTNEDLLTLITYWVYHSISAREINYRSLLTWVSWKDLHPHTVIQLIKSHPLFSTSEMCLSFILDILADHHLLKEPLYEALSSLKETVSQDVRPADENDKFLNMAISAAIGELKDKDKNFDSLCIFNESDRYLLEKDFVSKGDIMTQDLPSFESDQSRTDHLIQSCANKVYLESADKINGCYNECCSEYCSCQNDLCLVANTDADYYEGLTETQDNESVDPAEKRDETISSMMQGCCHYSHSNSEHCPAITNKKSYINHKYQVNHTMLFNDTNVYKKGYSTNYRIQHSPSFLDDFTLNSCDGAERTLVVREEDVSRIDMSTTAYHSEILASGLESSGIKNDHLISYEVGKELDIEHIGCSSIRASEDYSLKGMCQPIYSYFVDTDEVNPQDMSLPHPRSSEIAHYGDSGSKHYSTYDDDTTIDGDHFESPLDAELQTEDDLHKNLTSEYDLNLGKLEATSDNVRRQKMDTSSSGGEYTNKQTLKQKVMQKYREGNREKAVDVEMSDDNPKSIERPLETKKETRPPVKTRSKTADAKLCELCVLPFVTKKEYFVHMKEHFPGPQHHCDLCNSSFKRLYHLLDHRLTHSESKPIKCTECSFSTRKMFNLKMHMTNHTNAKPLECGECGEKFNQKQRLIKHFTKHTTDRPLVCETCGWTGKTKDGLFLHCKIHTGDLLSCQYNDCAYRTAKLSHLKEHMQYHTKSRPFTCQICGLNFMTKSHARRHNKIHLSPNSLQCLHCDYSTSRADLLKVHVKRRHSSTKRFGLLKSRKQQLKKKDGLMDKNSLHEASGVSNQEVSALQDNVCLYSALTTADDSLTMTPPLKVESGPLSSGSPNPSDSYLGTCVSESLVCDGESLQFNFPNT